MKILPSLSAIALAGIVLAGCTAAPKLVVNIDPAPLSQDEATVIIYHEDFILSNQPVFLDRTTKVGIITPEEPIKFSVAPGTHDLHIDARGSNINRVMTMEFEAGDVYFFRAWTSFGSWTGVNKLTLVAPIELYNTVSHKPRK